MRRKFLILFFLSYLSTFKCRKSTFNNELQGELSETCHVIVKQKEFAIPPLLVKPLISLIFF